MSSGPLSNDPCHLRCRWNGKDMCVRCLLSPQAIAEHHLSLGVSCGLRQIYYPHELPPCLHHNGDLDWHYSDDAQDMETEMEEAYDEAHPAPASHELVLA